MKVLLPLSLAFSMIVLASCGDGLYHSEVGRFGAAFTAEPDTSSEQIQEGHYRYGFRQDLPNKGYYYVDYLDLEVADRNGTSLAMCFEAEELWIEYSNPFAAISDPVKVVKDDLNGLEFSVIHNEVRYDYRLYMDGRRVYRVVVHDPDSVVSVEETQAFLTSFQVDR